MKLKSYAFLFVLVLILIFVLGVRYGQNVEKTNKAVDLVLKQPTLTPAPTNTPLDFNSYKNSKCGIQFLVPNSFKIQSESSNSAKFNDGKVTSFQFDCLTQKIFVPAKNSTAAATFKNKKIIVEKTGAMERFQVYNSIAGKYVNFDIATSLYSLLEKTLEFTVAK